MKFKISDFNVGDFVILDDRDWTLSRGKITLVDRKTDSCLSLKIYGMAHFSQNGMEPYYYCVSKLNTLDKYLLIGKNNL